MSQENQPMNDPKQILEALRKRSRNMPFLAQQGLDLPDCGVRQLHKNKGKRLRKTIPETEDFFFLITEVKEKSCTVIPGSMNGLMAGPDDIVLPKNVLGQYVFLSPKLATPLPKAALGSGFAVLDELTFNRILSSLPGKKTAEAAPFPPAMPYISKHDERRSYHDALESFVEGHKKAAPKLLNAVTWKRMAYAASALFVGAIVTVSFWSNYDTSQNNTIEGVTPQIPQTEPVIIARTPSSGDVTGETRLIAASPKKFYPSGTFRGVKTAIQIYSPRLEMFSDRPSVAIGGDKEKTYTISIFENNQLIATKEMQGGDLLPWKEISSQPLMENDIYFLEIRENEKIIAVKEKHLFWLKEQCERQAIIEKMPSVWAKSTAVGCLPVSGTLAKIAEISGNMLNDKDQQFYQAQHLLKNGCPSDAYVIARKLRADNPSKKEYQELLNQCLKAIEYK